MPPPSQAPFWLAILSIKQVVGDQWPLQQWLPECSSSFSPSAMTACFKSALDVPRPSFKISCLEFFSKFIGILILPMCDLVCYLTSCSAYTPETFPGPSRGTGCGIAHSLGRLGGICAPLIAANIGPSNPSLPIYLSGGLILAGCLAMYCLRIETKHRHAS